MSSVLFNAGLMGRAERQFREAFERLKQGKPLHISKGSKISQNNVAKEAGVDPSALRRTRFPTLVADIQNWIEAHQEDQATKSPRRMVLATRSRNRGLRERIEALQAQRDNALSRLVEAESRIVDLTIENERIRALLPISNVSPLHQVNGPVAST